MNHQPSTAPPSAVFYGRVSTSKQDGSLETQDLNALAYAQLKGLDVGEMKFLESDTSGGIPFLERDQGLKLVNTLKLYAQAGKPVQHLIVTKLDRLGRSTIDVLNTIRMFKEMGLTVHIVDCGGDTITTRGPIGEFFLTILAAVAELERAFIRDRIRDRMTTKRQKGELCGTEPYGYDKAGTGRLDAKDKEIFQLIDNPEEQQWIHRMTDWRNAGWSYKRIADMLNSMGAPTQIPKGTMICVRKHPVTKEKIYQPASGRWQCGNVAGVLNSKYTRDMLADDARSEAA